MISPLDYSPVLTGLAVGGMPPVGDAVRLAGFRVLVLTAAQWQPAAESFPGVSLVRAPLEDQDAQSGASYRLAEEAAAAVADAVRRGYPTLVTCLEGRNRSTLVTALAVRLLRGGSGAEAVALVKRARPRNPTTRGATFTNPGFNSYLRAKPSRPTPVPPRPR